LTSGRSWPALLATLLAGETLSTEDTAWAMNEVMSGAATPTQITGFVVALRAKGETAEEMTGLVQAMLGRIRSTSRQCPRSWSRAPGLGS
jgi:anthranilate phosphoribosyltransferase